MGEPGRHPSGTSRQLQSAWPMNSSTLQRAAATLTPSRRKMNSNVLPSPTVKDDDYPLFTATFSILKMSRCCASVGRAQCPGRSSHSRLRHEPVNNIHHHHPVEVLLAHYH